MQTEKSPADFKATDNGNAPNPPEEAPYACHLRPGFSDTAGASSAQHLDPNTKATKWKDVLMPFPLKVQSPFTIFKGAFPKPKVLVLDMNGVLMRRFPYPELVPKCPQSCYRSKAYKRIGNMGTTCIARGDAYDFIQACNQVFNLCLWSSCTKPNIEAAMKGIFKGLHPKVLKDVLTQNECIRLPFKLNEVRNLEESERKPLFLKAI